MNKETCKVCGQDACTKEDPQCVEYWEMVEGEQSVDLPIIILNTTPTITKSAPIVVCDTQSKLNELLESKIPEVKKFAELIEAASEESQPLLIEELERLCTKQKNPGWLNQYIDLLINGTDNQSSAAKKLGIAQCQVSNFFGKNNLRNLQTLIMYRNRFSTQNDLEAELMRRVMSGKSDNLLMFKLKQLDSTYRDNTQVTVNNNTINAWKLELD
jgi:hypothetical protein